MENFANFRCLGLNLSLFKASAEGASEKFRVLQGNCLRRHYFQIPLEKGIRPLLTPLRTPMRACSLISKFCFSQNAHAKFSLKRRHHEIFKDKHKYQLDLHIRQSWHGRPQKCYRGGQNHQHCKKLTHFRRAVQKIDHFSARPRRERIFLRFICAVLD